MKMLAQRALSALILLFFLYVSAVATPLGIKDSPLSSNTDVVPRRVPGFILRGRDSWSTYSFTLLLCDHAANDNCYTDQRCITISMLQNKCINLYDQNPNLSQKLSFLHVESVTEMSGGKAVGPGRDPPRCTLWENGDCKTGKPSIELSGNVENLKDRNWSDKARSVNCKRGGR
ncbi:hypothetical protein EJ08DRAFT_697279 [Tothia fuscella]|uniref:Uncharacterized protein n=1 Tax=Tothia fuscella TaxID=1048955 RepID=A0A9P4TYE9_9PEZI|nr:hypothetical protein EJ08DRAFT_697279 [Tothia fuscella]